MNYEDVFYPSGDGLKLYARDYHSRDHSRNHRRDHRGDHRGDADLVVLCLHGLTRNSADFAELADALSRHYRVIVADQRGRGRSEYDTNPERYRPAVYVEDMECLLESLHISTQSVLLVGTSMGGLMSMMLAARRPGEFRGLVLNDIGPVVDEGGLRRIKSYVGRAQPVRNWSEAVDQCRQINGPAYPDFNEEQWLNFARALYAVNAEGVPEPAYDPAISQAMAESEEAAVPAVLWPLFDRTRSVPMLLIRGALSDILSADCAGQMCERHPDCRYLELANRGHAPTLAEAASLDAIAEFIAYCAAARRRPQAENHLGTARAKHPGTGGTCG